MPETPITTALFRVDASDLTAKDQARAKLPVLQIKSYRSLLRDHGPFIRTLLYGLLVTAYFALIARLVGRDGPLPLFKEGGLIELTQLACILATALLMAGFSKTHADFRSSLRVMALLALLASVRELNNTELYRRVFFFGSATWVAGGLACGVLLWLHRRRLPHEMNVLLRQPAALLLALGFMIIVGWAQVFAQRALLPVKELDRIVEEGIECAGYILILFGTLELHLNLRVLKRRHSSF